MSRTIVKSTNIDGLDELAGLGCVLSGEPHESSLCAASVIGSLSDHDALLAEIVRRLVDAYQPERVYLFGSKARGDAGPDSDYDLLVVAPDDAPPERRDSKLAEGLWGVEASVDAVVCRQ